MAKFTVRVELHAANAADYETLHAAMRTEGFSQFITSGDGVKYHLPTAEYNREGNFTQDHVLQLTKSAVAKVNKKAAILVTEAVSRTWEGLQSA